MNIRDNREKVGIGDYKLENILNFEYLRTIDDKTMKEQRQTSEYRQLTKHILNTHIICI